MYRLGLGPITRWCVQCGHRLAFPCRAELLASTMDRRRGDTGLRRTRMERFIATLVQGLDSVKIDRSEFCKSVALAAAVYGAGDSGQAQGHRGFKIIGMNHKSYT